MTSFDHHAELESYNQAMRERDEAHEIWKDCEVCGGEGVIYKPAFVYEAGCGFGHDDVHSVECDACAGNGGFICEDEGDSPSLPNGGRQ